MGSLTKCVPGFLEIRGSVQKKDYIMYFLIYGPRGASDHKNDCRNEKFRQFEIEAVYHFFLRDEFCEKLRPVKARNLS